MKLSKSPKIYMTPTSMQNFFDREYTDYPDIKTNYGVQHPGEMIKNLRELLIKNPGEENWAKHLLDFIENSPLYQMGYQTVVKDEKQQARYLEQLRERQEEDLSALEEDDDGDDSLLEKIKGYFTNTFSVEQKREYINSTPQGNKNFLYKAYLQKLQRTDSTQISEISEVLKIEALVKTEFPKIQEKYREIWQNYKALNTLSVLLKGAFQDDRQYRHLQNLDQIMLNKFELNGTKITEMQQKALLRLHIGLSDLLAAVRSLATLNRTQLSKSEVKGTEPLKVCLENRNLLNILNDELAELKKKYDEALANKVFTAITLYLEAIGPLIAKLSSFTEFKQLEGYRQDLLKQMETLNILPDEILKTSAEVSVQYDREEINNLLKEMEFRIKRSYFNHDYSYLLEKKDNNRKKRDRLNKTQKGLDKDSSEFSQIQAAIEPLDKEYNELVKETQTKYPDECKKHNSIRSLLTGLNGFVNKEAVFSQPENLSILKMYQEWYEKMALEINKFNSILPRLMDIAGTNTVEIDSKFPQRLQHEGHQRRAEQASLFTVQSKMSSVLALINIELKGDGFEGNLFKLLEIKPALQDCRTYKEQWLCLRNLIEKITQKTSKASDLSAQWQAAFSSGKTRTDACLIPQNGEQVAFAKELISSLSPEQLNPLLTPIYDFAEANLLLISKMDQILKMVGVNPELDDRGRKAVRKSYTELAPLLQDFYELYIDNEAAARNLCATLQEIGGEFLPTEKLYQSLLSHCKRMEDFFASLRQPCLHPTSAWDSVSVFDKFKTVPQDLNKPAKNWYTDFEKARTLKLKSVFNPLQGKELLPITPVASSITGDSQRSPVALNPVSPNPVSPAPPLLSTIARNPQSFAFSIASTLSSSSSSSLSSS